MKVELTETEIEAWEGMLKLVKSVYFYLDSLCCWVFQNWPPSGHVDNIHIAVISSGSLSIRGYDSGYVSVAITVPMQINMWT